MHSALVARRDVHSKLVLARRSRQVKLHVREKVKADAKTVEKQAEGGGYFRHEQARHYSAREAGISEIGGGGGELRRGRV
jgi:hypothetical protein